jgi:periplasmic protein TonB
MKKKLLFLFLMSLVVQLSFSQAPISVVKQIPIAYEVVESQPEFPGGMPELTKFINKNLKMPELENTGDIIVSFIVETDGSIIEAKVIKDLGNGSGNEVKRVVLMQPKWKPGEVAGKPVRVSYSLPIKIR